MISSNRASADANPLFDNRLVYDTRCCCCRCLWLGDGAELRAPGGGGRLGLGGDDNVLVLVPAGEDLGRAGGGGGGCCCLF